MLTSTSYQFTRLEVYKMYFNKCITFFANREFWSFTRTSTRSMVQYVGKCAHQNTLASHTLWKEWKGHSQLWLAGTYELLPWSVATWTITTPTITYAREATTWQIKIWIVEPMSWCGQSLCDQTFPLFVHVKGVVYGSSILAQEVAQHCSAFNFWHCIEWF